MKTLEEFLTEALESTVWKVKYIFTPEDIEFFKKDPKFNWDAVVKMFGGTPTEVACNQKNLIVTCFDTQASRYMWLRTQDVPAKRVKTKDDSGLDASYIKDVAAAALDADDKDGKQGVYEIAIQGLKWMIERGTTK
jgi:hypothetical protein